MNHVSFLLTRSYKDANRLSNATADWNLISQNCFWLLYMCFWNKLGQHNFCLWILLQLQHIHNFDILSWHNIASCCKNIIIVKVAAIPMQVLHEPYMKSQLIFCLLKSKKPSATFLMCPGLESLYSTRSQRVS